jgi:hypothetical protein
MTKEAVDAAQRTARVNRDPKELPATPPAARISS